MIFLKISQTSQKSIVKPKTSVESVDPKPIFSLNQTCRGHIGNLTKYINRITVMMAILTIILIAMVILKRSKRRSNLQCLSLVLTDRLNAYETCVLRIKTPFVTFVVKTI